MEKNLFILEKKPKSSNRTLMRLVIEESGLLIFAFLEKDDLENLKRSSFSINSQAKFLMFFIKHIVYFTITFQPWNYGKPS